MRNLLLVGSNGRLKTDAQIVMPMKEAFHPERHALLLQEHSLAKFVSMVWDSSFGRNDILGAFLSRR